MTAYFRSLRSHANVDIVSL